MQLYRPNAGSASECLAGWPDADTGNSFVVHEREGSNIAVQRIVAREKLVERVRANGPRLTALMTDAHIAALAIENQATVHSNDSDFSRFPGLHWINPLNDVRAIGAPPG